MLAQPSSFSVCLYLLSSLGINPINQNALAGSAAHVVFLF